jgi:hypothetical protein
MFIQNAAPLEALDARARHVQRAGRMSVLDLKRAAKYQD